MSILSSNRIMQTAAFGKIIADQEKDKDMSQAIVLDLKKKLELNLTKAGIINIPVLQTRAAVDCSGSMSDNFKHGFVEKAVDLFIVAALKFDDNESLELAFFNDNLIEVDEAQEPDVGKYMATKGRKIYASGGTEFSPIIAKMESKLRDGASPRIVAPVAQPKKGFFGNLIAKVVGAAAPTMSQIASAGLRVEPDRGYVGIITDGACSRDDKAKFEAKLEATSGDTFYQFIGIGDQVERSYLDRLAAKYKHVAVFYIDNPLKLDDDKFYELVCNPKFVSWCNVNG